MKKNIKSLLSTGFIFLLFGFYSFLTPVISFGQTSSSKAFSLNSPYGCVYQLLKNLQEDSYHPEIAAQTLNSNVDSLEKIKRSIQIKQVLDGRGLYVRMNNIPDQNNYRDSISKRNIYTLFPDELPEVYLEKIDSLWFISEETVSLTPSLHKKLYPLGLDRFLENLPNSAEQKILGLKLWQLTGLLILLFSFGIFQFVLTRIINYLLSHSRWINKFTEETVQKHVFKLARYSSFSILIIFLKTFLPVLQLPISFTDVAFRLLNILLSISLLFIFLEVVNVLGHYARKLAEETSSKMDDQLLPILKTLAKIILIVIASFHILSLLQVNVTAIIAGISIGGLALALAAQDTVKNLIGSVLIFVDRPFQIGDYIIADGIEGTVEEVGFRTSRIRMVDTSVVAVPNGSLSNMALKNLGIRNFRMMQVSIGVLYSTPLQTLQLYVEKLKEIVYTNPKIYSDNYYIHFNEMRDSSLNILFRVYLEVENYKEELIEKEKILFKIMNEAEQLGVEFAFPTSTIHIEK